jgi:ATP-binding cassette subfamily B protein
MDGVRRGKLPDHSGLTGSPSVPEPPAARGSPAGRWRGLWRAVTGTIAGVPRVLRLVWRVSPGLTCGLALATVGAGLIPAATAYTLREVVNAVLHAVKVRGAQQSDRAPFQIRLPFSHGGITVATLSTAGVVIATVLLLLVWYVLGSICAAVSSTTQQLLQDRVQQDVQLLVMDHASRLDLAFFEGSESYDLLRHAQKEADSRPVTMISTAFTLLRSAITFGSMIALLVGLSPLIALITLITPVPGFLSDARYGHRGFLLARWASPLRRRMDYVASLVTTDSSAKEVKLFDLGPYFVRRYRLMAETYNTRQRRLVLARYLTGAAWGLLSTAASALTLLYVALRAVSGALTIGDLTLYTQASTSIQAAVQGLFQGSAAMYEHNLYLNTLYEFLDRPVGVAAPAAPRPLPVPPRGAVVLDGVSFRYPGGTREVLSGIDLVAEPGQMIAVVGRNGAGKSTLVKLLCRLYDPTAGRITLDGVDLREVAPADLRRTTAAMFQDYVRYQATVAENIGLGDLRHLTDSPRIAAAADQAGLAGLVDGLELGYDTPLGKWFDHGIELSGGEWQKVALARAFVRDGPVLLLDEPSAALDAQAEHDLFARLRLLAQGRTTFYVSHRFSAVRRADRIIVLDGGRIVEDGDHDALIRLGGRYARLFHLQAAPYTGGSINGSAPDRVAADHDRDTKRRADGTGRW